MAEDTFAELTRQLEEARREAAYYQRLSREGGERRLREAEQLSDLIVQLRQAEKELEKARSELERRVEERTAKLAMTNKRLMKEIAERRRIEQELRKTNELLVNTEERYRLLIENAEFPILVTALTDARVLYINKRAAVFFGLPVREAVGEYAPDYWVYPDSRERFIAELVREGRVTGFEALLQTRTGDQRWVLISANLIEYIDKRASFTVFSDITERKRMEEELRASREELDKYFMNSLDLLCIADKDGYFRRLNAQWAKTLGYPLSELEGKPFLDFVHPDDVVSTVQAAAELTAGREVLDFVNRYGHRDGSYRWIEWRSFPVGKSIFAIARDITERKRAEEALRESEEKYRRLHESMRDGFVSVDLGGRIQDFNPAYVHLLGYPEEELRSLTYQDLTPERWHAYEADILERQVLVRGYSDVYEKEYRRGDGPVFPVELRTYLIRDPFGQPVGYWAIVRDITDRKRSEERLNRINSVLLDLGHDFDRNLRVLTELCGQLLGADCTLYSRLERGVLCVKGGWQAPSDLKVVDNPEGHLCYDVIRSVSDGVLVIRNLQQTSYAITDPNVAAYGLQTYLGHPVHFGGVKRGSLCVVYSRDYEPSEADLRVLGIIASALGQEEERERAKEERLQLERRLLDAQKLESLGIMAGGIAHDFNNLLAVIIGNLDLSLLRLPQDSPARVRLEQAMVATRRAVDLTGQMLAYSGMGRFVITRVDLSQLVREKADLFRAVVAKTNTLNLQSASGPLWVEADSGQLQQVIINLITNASEAMEEKPGTVTVTTAVLECGEAYLDRSRLEEKPQPGRFVYVEVADTGCGMDELTQQRLFDPFFTTKFVGRGLGMSAVLGIVRAHKGAIMVESEPGLGTSIRVFFPAVRKQSGPADSVSKESQPLSGPRTPARTVLLVDDEELVREMAATFLDDLGYQTITAADGKEALRLFKQHENELTCVLLDLTMPRMDGVSTFREMMRVRTDVPIILSSGYTEEDATHRLTDQELAGFIQKPYRLQNLRNELDRVLKVFRERDREG